jgi:hypothetical protein
LPGRETFAQELSFQFYNISYPREKFGYDENNAESYNTLSSQQETGQLKQLFVTILFCLCLTGATKAQWPKNLILLPGNIEGKDTIAHIELPEVGVFPKRVFKSRSEEQQYWRLVMRVKKVWPYAKEAAILLRKYELEVPQEAKNRDRRQYIRRAEDELMKKYGPAFKKMSINDGKVLIKLIDRETHRASYEIIQEVKGSVPAVFWQGVARIFGNNLKSRYDPYGEDRQIELIIQYIELGII